MLFFIDESGCDQKEAPYEVLAAISIREDNLWKLINDIHNLEEKCFGLKLTEIEKELKGRKLLKNKIFRLAQQSGPIEQRRRTNLCRDFLLKGYRELKGYGSEERSKEEFTAYGQAILGFVKELIAVCSSYRVKLFASMVVRGAPRPPSGKYLRKDYAYLFERIFYYLEDISPDEQGIIVFDEIEKASARLLIDQMEEYFLNTAKGRMRSSRIIPQPFFVHSELTTAVQIADILAYCLNWGFRITRMNQPIREEMKEYGELASGIRYIGRRFDEFDSQEWPVWGVVELSDLRPRTEREEEK